MIELTVPSHHREELIDVTALIQKAVTDNGAQRGFVICFVPHTTAAITINENADPDVAHDIIHKLTTEFPQNDDYRHSEGNSDAHLKSSLVGCTIQLLFENSRLILGRWQAVYFCEFDGPRSRRLLLDVFPRV
jgi:secondary thiamine-phosphate synthase enzyme